MSFYQPSRSPARESADKPNVQKQLLNNGILEKSLLPKWMQLAWLYGFFVTLLSVFWASVVELRYLVSIEGGVENYKFGWVVGAAIAILLMCMLLSSVRIWAAATLAFLSVLKFGEVVIILKFGGKELAPNFMRLVEYVRIPSFVPQDLLSKIFDEVDLYERVGPDVWQQIVGGVFLVESLIVLAISLLTLRELSRNANL